MKLQCGNISINFMLNPGVYTDWSSDSATGKTRTFKLLKSLVAAGHNNILLITYDLIEAGGTDKYIQLIRNNKYDIIFVDRADMYMNDNLFTELENSEAIVYVDIKSNKGDYKYLGRECYMDFSLEEIKYYVDDI